MTRTRRTLATLTIIAGSVAAVQLPDPALIIESPRPEAGIVGSVTFAARVEPAAARVREIAFYVDGQLACRAATAPYGCEWKAGKNNSAMSIRAVAELVDGRRVVQTLRVAGSEANAPVFSSAVEAVWVPVQVMDGRGRPVGGLKADQFRLMEDGVAQHVLSFSSQETAAQVLLVLDVSGSMAVAMTNLKDAVGTFLKSLRPQDVVGLAGLNQGLFVLSPPTVERSLTRAAVSRLRAQGATAFYDGLIRAATLVKNWPTPRTIVAFTDGDDVASLSSFDAARAALQRHDVVLYLIAQGRAFQDRPLQQRLERLAEETGGAGWFAKNMTTLARDFTEISMRLSGQAPDGTSLPAR